MGYRGSPFGEDDDEISYTPPHADLEETLAEYASETAPICLVIGGLYHNYRRMGLSHEEALPLANMTFFIVRSTLQEKKQS